VIEEAAIAGRVSPRRIWNRFYRFDASRAFDDARHRRDGES
jgi:hypothetical protein